MKVDESKRTQSSIASKDKNGVWDISNVGIFLPERWLIKDEHDEIEFDPRAGPAHPFGGGPRGCFGKCGWTIVECVALTLPQGASLLHWS